MLVQFCSSTGSLYESARWVSDTKRLKKWVAIATLKTLWVEFQAHVRRKNSIRTSFPSAWLVCLCCARSERLQSRKYSNEWLVSGISFRWVLCQGGMPRQNFVTASSYLLKQPVRTATTREFWLGTWPTVGWKSRFKLLLLRAGYGKHGLFFAPGGMLNLYKVKKSAWRTVPSVEKGGKKKKREGWWWQEMAS